MIVPLESVRALFSLARLLASSGPHVMIFFDEIDALTSTRGDNDGSSRRVLTGTLFVTLDFIIVDRRRVVDSIY